MSTFIYIQTVDTGLAPCVHRGIWSLALCKPTIRRMAGDADIIIAVTPKSDGHRLSSWARIDKRIRTKEFSVGYPKTRPDNIYEMRPNGRFARHSAVKHNQHDSPGDLIHDLGRSQEKAFVLISRDFYAFGQSAVEVSDWTKRLPFLRAEIRRLGRAFRRNFDPRVIADLEKLETRLKRDFSNFRKRRFTPRHPGINLPCESKAEEKRFTCVGDRAQ